MTLTPTDIHRAAAARAVPTEEQIQRAVIDLLRVAGRDVMWLHPANEGRRSRIAGHRLKQAGMVPGAPDLIVLLPGGACVHLELKTLAGRQTPAQRAFQDRARAIGHRYELVRSVDDAERVLRDVGAI